MIPKPTTANHKLDWNGRHSPIIRQELQQQVQNQNGECVWLVIKNIARRHEVETIPLYVKSILCYKDDDCSVGQIKTVRGGSINLW